MNNTTALYCARCQPKTCFESLVTIIFKLQLQSMSIYPLGITLAFSQRHLQQQWQEITNMAEMIETNKNSLSETQYIVLSYLNTHLANQVKQLIIQ